MATYEYRCSCGTIHRDYPIGTAPRTLRCGDHTKRLVIGAGVQIAPSALESKGQAVRNTLAEEKTWDEDRPAYKRMRAKGMQPPHVKGSAALENQVADQFDIDNQHLYPVASRHEIEESYAAQQMSELGVA